MDLVRRVVALEKTAGVNEDPLQDFLTNQFDKDLMDNVIRYRRCKQEGSPVRGAFSMYPPAVQEYLLELFEEARFGF